MNQAGTNGSNTTVAFPAGTVTGYGGGYGGSNAPSSTQSNGNPGNNHPNTSVGSGSGGGANKNTSSDAGAGGPAPLGAYPGGSMPGGNHYCGAGGGGAGGAGGRGSDAPGGRDASEILGDGLGGIGLQVPTTFRDPKAIYDGVHPGSQWYLAGGGGGGLFNPTPKSWQIEAAKVAVVMVAVEILELVIRQALDLKVEMVSLVLAVVVVGWFI